jgi:hypothetical protein
MNVSGETEPYTPPKDINRTTCIGVATIRDVVNSWLRWDDYIRSKERGPIDDDMHALLYIPEGVTRGTLKRWVECLTDAEMMLNDYTFLVDGGPVQGAARTGQGETR